LRDAAAWRELRRVNADWLRPWEATLPVGEHDAPMSFAGMVRRLRADAREGRALPWVITLGDALVGQVTVGGIARGSLLSGYIGYWIDSRVAGQGITPTAVAMACDHCFGALGLHRIEINIRPENAASLRVVEKLGFRSEGLRERYLHIDGDWRDHLTFALCREEVPEGVLRRWQVNRARIG
jgi:[ribosomal protein S5]-alanine N-acetyltransferase